MLRRRRYGAKGDSPAGSRRVHDLLSVCVASALVAACAQQTPVVKPDGPPLNLSGFSAPFKQGFADGCETAKGRYRKAEDRFKADAQYARGWEDGRAICARR